MHFSHLHEWIESLTKQKLVRKKEFQPAQLAKTKTELDMNPEEAVKPLLTSNQMHIYIPTSLGNLA